MQKKNCCKQVLHIQFQHFKQQLHRRGMWKDADRALFFFCVFFFKDDANYIQLMSEQQMASCGKMSGILLNLDSNK